MNQTRIFICYPRADRGYLDELKPHLKESGPRGLVEAWDDSQIKPGVKWRPEIRRALATSRVAILLVSPEFLKSEFITSNELPVFLAGAEASRTAILPILVRPCGDEELNELREYQAFNPPPDKPLAEMSGQERQRLYERVAARVREIVMEDSGPAGFIRRWRHSVLPFFAGTALSMTLAVLSAPYVSRWPSLSIDKRSAPDNTPCISVATPSIEKRVFVVGSGTVYSYLKEAAPCAFVDLRDNTGINVLLLQGPTRTGATLFGHIHEQIPTLVMAASDLEIDTLRRSVAEKTVDRPDPQPRAVFEVYLGADALQMLLVPVKNSGPGAFEDLMAVSSVKSTRQLHYADLVGLDAWTNGSYTVYAGSEGAGTKDLWERRLRGAYMAYLATWDKDSGARWNERLANFNAWWGSKLHVWDIQNPHFLIQSSSTPNIYLGSELLIEVERNRNPDILKDIKILTMLDGPNLPARRGLYLYGQLKLSDEKKPGKPGYYLPEHMTEILKYLFKALEGSPRKLLDAACLQNQKEYFHLNESRGWVGTRNRTDDDIYRAEPCPGQPPRIYTPAKVLPARAQARTRSGRRAAGERRGQVRGRAANP